MLLFEHFSIMYIHKEQIQLYDTIIMHIVSTRRM